MCQITLLKSFCKIRDLSKILQKLFIMGLMLQVVSCNEKEVDLTTFKSNFTNQTSQVLNSSEYRLSPIDDWQVANNRMECLVSGKNRNVHLLTRELSKKEGNLEMQVDLGFFNNQISNSNKNWAGFCITSKDMLSDTDVYNSSLNIGVSTNGTLFIGEPGPNHKNQKVIEKLSKGLNLIFTIEPNGKTYSLYVSINDMETGTLLSKISKKGVMPNQLIGNLVLVSNFEDDVNKNTLNKKSVWFKNWEIRGAKLEIKKENLSGITKTNY